MLDGKRMGMTIKANNKEEMGPYHAQQVVLHHISVSVVVIHSQSVGNDRQINRVSQGRPLCAYNSTSSSIGSAGSTTRHGDGHAEVRGMDGIAHLVQQRLEYAVQLGLVQIAVSLGGSLVQMERRPAS